MSENGHYDGQFELLMGVVNRIDERTERHDEKHDTQIGHLKTIADNTGTIAKHYGAVQTDNRELSKLAAGKNQIHISVFIVLMFLCGAYVLTEKVSQGDIEIKVSLSGIEITHGKKSGGD